MVDKTKLKWADATQKIEAARDADVFFYNARITPDNANAVLAYCLERKRRKNAFVVLVTNGGSPDAAYRIARCFQEKYETFSIYLTGVCKSAGTLICLGAHELVVSDYGELGPFDVQVPKSDDLFDSSSGLSGRQALRLLSEMSYEAFETYFRKLQRTTAYRASMKTSCEVATDLATGLYGKLFEQLDPLTLAEASRSMEVAWEYGKRLAEKTGMEHAGIRKLLEGYPSHGYVIDRSEASGIFPKVTEPNGDEEELGKVLHGICREQGRTDYVFPLSDEPVVATPEPEEHDEPSTDILGGNGTNEGGSSPRAGRKKKQPENGARKRAKTRATSTAK